MQFAETAKFLGYAKTVFESRGYTVETLRIVTQPFPEYTKGLSNDDAVRFFKNLDGLAGHVLAVHLEAACLSRRAIRHQRMDGLAHQLLG